MGPKNLTRRRSEKKERKSGAGGWVVIMLWPAFVKQFHIKAHKEGGSTLRHPGEAGTAARSPGRPCRGLQPPRRPLSQPPGRPADACDPPAWLTAEEALLYCGRRRSEHSAAEQDGVARHHPARCARHRGSVRRGAVQCSVAQCSRV